MRQVNVQPVDPSESSMSYIRWYYGVPARRRGRVFFGYDRNTQGTITGARHAYLRIRLDGEKRSGLYHPTWELDYLQGDDGVKLADVSEQYLTTAQSEAGYAVWQYNWGYGLQLGDQILGATLRQDPSSFIADCMERYERRAKKEVPA